jgi:hypothetical protein
MNMVATILNGELLGPCEELSSDSFSSNGLSDPKSANEESIPKCVTQRPAIVASDSRQRFVPMADNMTCIDRLEHFPGLAEFRVLQISRLTGKTPFFRRQSAPVVQNGGW